MRYLTKFILISYSLFFIALSGLWIYCYLYGNSTFTINSIGEAIPEAILFLLFGIVGIYCVKIEKI